MQNVCVTCSYCKKLDNFARFKNKFYKHKNRLEHCVLAFSFGTPGGARTPNNLIRSQGLYPIELRVHTLLL